MKTSHIDWEQLRHRLAQVAAGLDRPAVDPQTRTRILKARARAAAREPQPALARTDYLDVVEFTMSYERHAVEIAWVREVLALRELTPLPGTPPFVAGVVNVRGRIVSVVDLKVFFELPAKGLPDLNRLLVVSDGSAEFGLLVDAVSGLRQVPRAQLQSTLPTMSGVREDYLLGITVDGLAVLDAGRIVRDPNLVVRQERG